MPLPEYLIYRKKGEISGLQIREIRGGKEVGISVSERNEYGFPPGERSTETFINKLDAVELIQALQEYFHII